MLRRLKEVYGDHVAIEYRMGGTFDDIAAWRQEYGVDEESTVDWVRESFAMMKMPLDPDYLRRTGVRSTYPACLAFKAAQRQDPHKAERYFRRLMEAFMVETRPATEEELIALAAEVGLDGDLLGRDMASPEVATAFEEDRQAMKSSGVNFLSLAIEAKGETVVKGDIFSAEPFEDEIDRLAPRLPKRSPVDIIEYLEKMQGHLVPAHEVAEVFRISEEDAAERLNRLEQAGMLASRGFDFGTCWIPKPVALEKLPLDVVKISHVPPEAHVETTADLVPIVTAAVQNMYTEVATQPDKEYHFPLGLEAVTYVGYPEEDIAKLPPTAVESFAGVGYPFAADVIRPGHTVLDIGSGSGTDVLYASLKVGPQGKVYGLDFTPAMIEKARENIDRMGAGNVEIVEGTLPDIPLPNASVDVATSNGVLNLVPDKAAAFQEIFRILKPGGWLQLADIVVQEDVASVCGLNPQLWADCIGGAAVEGEYLQTIEEAGFVDVRVLNRLDYFAKSSSVATKRLTKTFGAESVVVVAGKP